MKQIHFQVNIDQLGGFCPAQIEGYHWEYDFEDENGDERFYRYDIPECYFNEDSDDIVEVTVITNEPDAEPAGVQDGFLWNIEKEAKKYF